MRLIDADKLRQLWFNRGFEYDGKIYNVIDFLNSIDKEPTIDAELRRYGKWVKNGPDDTVVYCDQCLMPQDSVCNRCPECGAIMSW